MDRVKTGINGLDEIIEGGYPRGRSILITGTSGSGKTIIGVSFIHQACQDGMKSLIIATEEFPDDIISQAGSVGKPLGKFKEGGTLMIDKVYEERTLNTREIIGYGIEVIEEMQSNIIGLLERIPGDIECVLIDNIGVFTLNMTANEFRTQFDTLIAGLAKKNITTILIMDSSADDRTENIASYSVYGMLKTSIKDNPFTGKRERLLEIQKMRNTKIALDPLRFDITSGGIELIKRSEGKNQ